MQFPPCLRCCRKIRIRLLHSGLGDKRFLSDEILIPFFLGLYLYGIIPVIVSIFAVLGIDKGTGAGVSAQDWVRISGKIKAGPFLTLPRSLQQ
jgi:hypothetical protein